MVKVGGEDSEDGADDGVMMMVRMAVEVVMRMMVRVVVRMMVRVVVKMVIRFND